MRSRFFPSCRRAEQQGYVMAALTLAVALVLIALAAAAPLITADLRRQREEELIHRGVQYARATKKYYRKFGTYPMSVQQLEDAHVLRRRYIDPMTGGDFRLLHPSDLHLSMPPSPASPASDLSTPTTAADSSSDDCTGDGQSTSSSSPIVSLTQMGVTGPVLDVGPIVGVASTSEQRSFHVFDGKDCYKDWQFVYSPLLDRGGLITRPYDGMPIFGNGDVPAVPTIPGNVPGQTGSPGFTPTGANP